MTAAYDAWVRAGRPIDGVARPLAELRDLLRGYGYTVYDTGDKGHMQHDPPEDHTPFSATGWPVPSPRWWIHAIDIMPPPPGRGLPSLLDLGQQIERDWPGWLKYLNRPTNTANTRAVHVSRQPNPDSRSSGDVGHIHLSARSDATHAAGDGYDPVARLRGQTTTSSRGDDDMLYTVKGGGDRTGAPPGSDPGAIYVASAMGPRWINGAEWGSLGSPQPMVCESYARIAELCPAVEVAAAGPVTVQLAGDVLNAALGELLSKIRVTGTLELGA